MRAFFTGDLILRYIPQKKEISFRINKVSINWKDSTSPGFLEKKKLTKDNHRVSDFAPWQGKNLFKILIFI